jgi:signal transduction histidine kinase
MSRGRLIVVLAVVLCLPSATITWLGYRLLEQDRVLEKQRIADSRELAVTQAVQRLSAILADPKLLVARPGDGAMLATGERPLLFRDNAPVLAEAPTAIYAEGETLEFQRNSADAASEVYRVQSKSPDPLVRAGALFRLGRSLNQAGKKTEALEAYSKLVRMESAGVGGWPAPVAALWSRCRVFESSGNKDALRAEAIGLRDLLAAGRYPLSRPAYDAFADDVARWTGMPRPVELEQLTEAVLAVQTELRDGRRPGSGRTVVPVLSSPVTVSWGQAGGQLAILAATPAFVEREWLSKAGPGVWLRDDGGRVVGRAADGQPSVRYAVESNLPWSVLAVAPGLTHDLGTRHSLLLIMLGAVGLFTLTGACVVVAALRRQFALARMQEDFVAAVSHEFRTPLTTLRQITECLEDGRVTDEKRTSYYQSLSRATLRLHRLVEDLLDFRRLQSGALVFRRARINVQKFTAQVVSDFEREAADPGFEISASSGPDVEVLADREALSRALWNLLDNAVKYSGDMRSVELKTRCRGRYVEWSVHDRGPGIAEAERQLVFQKFYRGEGARQAGIRGTGIGLTMVQEIVAAHGGQVSVSSREGAGSVFTISIPCEEPLCSES